MGIIGNFVKFKSNTFGIKEPENYGVIVSSKRDKNKNQIFQIFTTKGVQQISKKNLLEKDLGIKINIDKFNKPSKEELKSRLNDFIFNLKDKEEVYKKNIQEHGEFSIQKLWKLLDEENGLEKSYSLDNLIEKWYSMEIDDISRKRKGKIREAFQECQSYGYSYFDRDEKNKQFWTPIQSKDVKKIKREINELGNLRNIMFELTEVIDEETEEIFMKKIPKEWNNVKLNDNQKLIIIELQKIMKFFIIHDTWSVSGLAKTHVYSLDGFSLRNYVSNLAEDWVNEGRSSKSDYFLKFLIKSNYISQKEALILVSKRHIKLSKNFEWTIDDRIIKIAEKFNEPSETPEIYENRTDLRRLETYTIDPPTAKDFDDAISTEKLKEGFILWVHIADVAHYVKKDTTLDANARAKATSVYLPTKTLPMLPNHLSDNLCSLKENVDRLAMSVEIHINDKGDTILDKCKIHNSVILVDKNLNYDYVNQMINEKNDTFYELFMLSKLIEKNRIGLNLQTDELRLEIGDEMKLSNKAASNSTKMIENFMVLANIVVAELLIKNDIETLFRNHIIPDENDVDKLNAQLKIFDYEFQVDYEKLKLREEKEEQMPSIMDLLSNNKMGTGDGKITFSLGQGTNFVNEIKKNITEMEEETTSKNDELYEIKGIAQMTDEQRYDAMYEFRKGIDNISNINDPYFSKLIYITYLKSLSRATYDEKNIGHFGLGAKSYLHFTSPIRRYPDIIIHRLCKNMINKEQSAYNIDELRNIAEHCTEQSIAAEKLERTIIAVGFSFLSRNTSYTINKDGIVVSIFGGGVFVLLPNGIEARIPLSNLVDKPTFIDDFETMCFVGSRSNFDMEQQITPHNWRELLSEGDEPIEVIAKIGDRIAIEFKRWNHIEGKVEASPIRFLELNNGQYHEKLIEFIEK